jgi:hypothetical protein
MLGNTGGVGGQIGLGRMAQSASIGAGYVAGGAVLGLAVPVMLRIRRCRDREDVIVGDAGRGSACAAQGLPDIGGVDSEVLVSAG